MRAFLDNLDFLLFYVSAGALVFAMVCALEWLMIRWHERGRKPHSMRDWKHRGF